MKNKLFIAAFLSLFLLNFFLPSSLQKGFESLKIYNYFEAKRLFLKSLKNHPCGASYGLSIIYYRNDNPFYNIDSAYKYILLSEKKIKSSNAREKETLQKLNINHPAIDEQKEKIIQRAFEKAKTENTLESFNWFLTNFLHPSLQKEATSLRNKLAFDNAKKNNFFQSYKDFISMYPDAEQINDAKWLYDFTLFNSMTKSNNLETYEAFVKQFPNSPYLSQAEDSIFSFFTHNETVQEYRGFIKKYPDNHNVKKAWDIIYFLSTIDFTYSAIANFIFDFPDFPDKQRADADLQRSKMSLFPIMQNGKWGFIDSLGNIRIQCEYDWADNFSGGITMVIHKDKTGYINKADIIIIPLSYDEANTFHHGLAVVKKENKFGLISKTGKTILPFEFEDISGNESADNIIIALKEGIYKYYDAKGKFLFEGKYEKAGDFSSGRAYIIQNGQYGFINRKCEIAIPAIYNWAENFSTKDSHKSGTARIKLMDKFGLTDTAGKSILLCEYDRIDEFSEGLALLVKEKKFGFADEKGNIVIPIKFDYSSELSATNGFQNGLAKVEMNKKRGLLNKSGKLYIPCEYEDIRNFSEELCAVKRGGKWGYIDRNNKQKINFQFDYAWDFSASGGLARVKIKGKTGFINQKGEQVVPATYDEATDFINVRLPSINKDDVGQGISIVTSSGKKGILNSSGNLIIPNEMDEIEEAGKGMLKFEKNGKSAYFNLALQKQIWTEVGF